MGVGLLQHLTPRLRELEGQEAARCQGPRGEQDGHGFGDPDEGREDADPQDGRQLTESVEEAEGGGSENRRREGGVKRQKEEDDWIRTSSSSSESSPDGLRLPLIRGVELHRQHVQGVPGGDADASKQAEQSNHGRLAVAEGQEETADAGDDAGARWRRPGETGGGGQGTWVEEARGDGRRGPGETGGGGQGRRAEVARGDGWRWRGETGTGGEGRRAEEARGDRYRRQGETGGGEETGERKKPKLTTVFYFYCKAAEQR